MTERSSTPSPRPGRTIVVRRLGARAVDLFTVFFCTFALAVTVLVPVMAPLTDLLDRGPWGRSLAPALLIALVGITYETVFTAGRGQTPAKDLFCIKVVAASTPDPPARRRVAIRATLLWSWIVVPLPGSTVAAGVVIVFVVGMAAAALDPARRALHDRLLTTEVIAYDADAVEGAVVSTPASVIEARYGARSWWRSLAGMVTR